MERERDLIAALGNVRSVNNRISLDSFIGREIGDIAAVDSGLIGSQVEIVSHREQ